MTKDKIETDVEEKENATEEIDEEKTPEEPTEEKIEKEKPAEDDPAEKVEEKPEEKKDDQGSEVDPDTIHPIDVMASVIVEIDRQEARLKNKNAGSLKYELLNNLYPILKTAIQANINVLVDMAESEENAINEEMEESVLRMISICEKIMVLYETVKEKLEGENKEIWEEITDFAAEVSEKAEEFTQ